MGRKKSSNGSNKSEVSGKLKYKAVVIGASAGGFAALSSLLPQFEKNFPLPIIIVQHLYPESTDFMAQNLNAACVLKVREANEKETIRGGTVYIAPANYHLLLERDHTLSLTIDQKVNFSRPSIDVLFESAVDVYGNELIGVLLTGANSDGAQGLRLIKEAGGCTIIQNPRTAEVDAMPQSALDLFNVDFTLDLDDIYLQLKKVIES